MNDKMAINMYLSTIETKNQNEWTSRTERFTDTENIFMVARRGLVKGLSEKVRGLRSINWLLQNSHRDVKYSTGNIVNNILVTMYSVR